MSDDMILHDAWEGNLKHISLRLPRNKLIVFTGVSGSGKTTLARDTIYQECQRQYLEAMNFQGIQKPKLDYMKHVSPAIIITQNSYHKNPRSSVGTITNIYTDLRMLYEKLGKRKCIHCDNVIDASQCREEVEKDGTDFHVFLYCPHCGKRMPAITRTHFSFNTREGACPACQGMGGVLSLRKDRVFDMERSLEEGGVLCWEKRYGDYQRELFYKALRHYELPVPIKQPLKTFDDIQMALLYHGSMSDEFLRLLNEEPDKKGVYEGIYGIMMRRLSEKGGLNDRLKEFFMEQECPACHGERLCTESREITVNDTRLPQLTVLSLEELLEWLNDTVSALDDKRKAIIAAYAQDIHTKITRLIRIGLGYLTLDRMAMTLSGGEAQRLKLAATLDSEVCGLLYVLDEPTVGLHAKDTMGIIRVLTALRDKGNTLIVIEHDPDIMKAADHIVDIGPGAGQYGGEITACGSWDDLMASSRSMSAAYFTQCPGKQHVPRPYKQQIQITSASMHNLKQINVTIPLQVLTCVSGVSGSGKSTLIFDVLASSIHEACGCKCIEGLDQVDEIIVAGQKEVQRSRRSNIATFTSLYTDIRALFAKSEDAEAVHMSTKNFSFNTKGGRCETCEGLGYVISNMLFFEDIEVVCPTCGGRRFHDDVLKIHYHGASILDVLEMSVDEAITLFENHVRITKGLHLLQDVGLGYLQLGQSLSTLSGGEMQRLKLARELLHKKKKKTLYLIDEPTTGLHPTDITHFMKLLNRLVDEGNSVVVVEHNLQLIKEADWIIDMGKEGGIHGGEVIVSGTLDDVIACEDSYTGQFLKKEIEEDNKRRERYQHG